MTRNSIATCLALSAALGISTFGADGDQKAAPNSQVQKDRKPPREEKEAAAAEKLKASPAKKVDRAQSRWMEIKLTSTQVMLSELTRGNLAGVAKHARATQAIDSLEYWLRGREFRQRSEYHKQLNQYQFALRELARHAEDENIDGALESWLDVNRSCIECHKLLRDKKRAALKSKSTETKSNGPEPAAVKTEPKK